MMELTNNLDFHIDLHQRLGERVDLDETRVDSARKATELGDETDVALVDRLVRVGAADATRHSTEGSDERAESVDHTTIPAGVGGILGVGFDDLGVGRLEVLAARRLHLDDGVVGASCRACVGGDVAVGRPLDGVAVGLGEAHYGDWECLLGVSVDVNAVVVYDSD